MKQITVLGLVIGLLVFGQVAVAKTTIKGLLKKDGRVVALDTALEPKSNNQVKRIWIQRKKDLWVCYILKPDKSYCEKQK